MPAQKRLVKISIIKITSKAKKSCKKSVTRSPVNLGSPIINKRISVTPIAIVASAKRRARLCCFLREFLDKAAKSGGDQFLSAGIAHLVEKGYQGADLSLIQSIPESLWQKQNLSVLLSILVRHGQGSIWTLSN